MPHPLRTLISCMTRRSARLTTSNASRAAAWRLPRSDRRLARAVRSPARERNREPQAVLELLDRLGSPATVATNGGRFFGFVNGGALPASMAATWLAAAWDQNAALRVMSPAAAAFEDVALEWARDILGLPAGCGGAIVTGATLANADRSGCRPSRSSNEPDGTLKTTACLARRRSLSWSATKSMCRS